MRAEGEDRNLVLGRVAYSLLQAGVHGRALEDQLDFLNEAMCSPPLEPDEVSITMGLAIDAWGDDSSGTQDDVDPEVEEIKRRFFTADSVPPDTVPNWVVTGIAVEGGLSVVAGQAKLAGKTTWVFRMVRAILEGTPFLGKPTKQSSVVLLTEERTATLAAALRRAQLIGRPGLHILSYDPAMPAKFAQAIEAAVQVALENGAKLLVIDTLAQWAGLAGDSENSTGAALGALRPLQAAAAKGLAVLFVHHEPKGGGAIGQAGRGASAFSGAVDIILNLRRAEGAGHPNLRTLHGNGRFDEIASELHIELVGSDYEVRESSAVVQSTVRDEILRVLPREESQAMTVEEIKEATKGKKTTVRDALAKLLDDELIEDRGSGERNDPKRYWLAAGAVLSAPTDAANDDVADDVTDDVAEAE